MALEPLTFFESRATSDTFSIINAVDRFNLTSQANDELEYPQRAGNLVAIAAGSGSGSGSVEEVRTEIPSLREPADLYVGQVNDSTLFGGYYFPHLDLRNQPVNPGALERLRFEARGNDGGTPEEYIIVLLASDGGAREIPGGSYRRVYFETTDSPTTAGEYNRMGIELDQTLQNGNYEVIGAQVRGTDVNNFGFDFEDRTGIYGGFAVQDEHDSHIPFQEPGALGNGWGQFRDESPPDLVAFMTGTTDDVEGHIDIVGPVGQG